LILDQLEASYDHKEPIDSDSLTIEHVMPQTPTDWWKEQLGEDWASTHEYWLHTVGNLTLTGYNPELSNSDFPKKKAILAKSHVELNRYFLGVEMWDGDAIARRGAALAELALRVWPDFAHRNDVPEEETDREDEREEVATLLDEVLEQLGGAVAQVGTGRFRIHRLTDGRVVNLKYSRSHGKYYWFGLHASLWEDLRRAGATHMVLVLGTTGYATVPFSLMAEYVAEAGSSPKSDGTVRHYHLLVSTGPKTELYHHGKTNRISLAPFLSKGLPQATAPTTTESNGG
jgi:hypothetical protein